MGSQQDSEYYDNMWKQSGYEKEAENLRWFPVWQSVTDAIMRKLVVRQSTVRIIDLGCGPGHIAEVLNKTTGLPFSYIGYDFSSVAIKMAQEKHIGDRFKFKEADLSEYDFHESEKKDEDVIYVSVEFLEHVEFDREVIEKLKSGRSVFFSLPNFDDPGHVRFFAGEKEIRERYEDLLDIHSVTVMSDGYRFVIDSKRK